MKISQNDLKKKLNSGWEIEDIKKAKPKKKPKPLIREQVAEGIKESHDQTVRNISDLVDAMKNAFNLQSEATNDLKKQLQQVVDRKITVEMPPQRETKVAKKKWKFTVSRDGRGFIEDIIAEEI